jgi:hypothetical protein
MRHLFFVLALNVCACAATGAAHPPRSIDRADQAKALAALGVATTGTGYADGETIVSVQCAVTGGDAALDAKTVRRLAYDDIVKMRCGQTRAELLALKHLDIALSDMATCIKFAVKTADIKCQASK